MRYRVRTPDGELEYPSLRDVEQAYVQGLVDPQDEVLEEGATLWRKAESLPALARARRTSSSTFGSGQTLTVVGSVALGVVALYLYFTGVGVMWVLVIAMLIVPLLTRLMMKAFRRPPPR
ncbi:MAG TPA: hypothetical protein VF815_26970 [Myxococcaceae bacterium]|jgi:hypothetical protein